MFACGIYPTAILIVLGTGEFKRKKRNQIDFNWVKTPFLFGSKNSYEQTNRISGKFATFSENPKLIQGLIYLLWVKISRFGTFLDQKMLKKDG